MVFQCLQRTIDLPNEQWRVPDQAHRKRNLAEYEGEMEVDEQLIAAMPREAREVGQRAAKLIATTSGDCSVARGRKIAAIKANTSAYDTKTPHAIHGCADRFIPHGRAIDAFSTQRFDFMLADPPRGKCGKKDLEAMGGEDGRAIDGLSGVHGPAVQIGYGQSGRWAHYGRRPNLLILNNLKAL